MAKFNKRITQPLAEHGIRNEIPQASSEVFNQPDGWTDAYQTAPKAGGKYVDMADVNAAFYETQAALKETQDKCVTSVNGVAPNEEGEATVDAVTAAQLAATDARVAATDTKATATAAELEQVKLDYMKSITTVSPMFIRPDGTTRHIDFQASQWDAQLINRGAYHNSIYRGAYLGDTFTDAQKTAIKNGTFDNMFIGDYWSRPDLRDANGTTIEWQIAAFNYFQGKGQDAQSNVPTARYGGLNKTNHIVVIPRYAITTSTMAPPSGQPTTTGGYGNTVLKESGLSAIATNYIDAMFGRLYRYSVWSRLCVAANNGVESGWAWMLRSYDLPTSRSTCGCIGAFVLGAATTPFYANPTTQSTQFPLFMFNPGNIFNNTSQVTIGTVPPKTGATWLQDVVHAGDFAILSYSGIHGVMNVLTNYVVRPLAYICGTPQNN